MSDAIRADLRGNVAVARDGAMVALDDASGGTAAVEP